LNLNPGYSRWVILEHEPPLKAVVRGDRVLSLAESKGLNLARVFVTLGFEDYLCLSIVGGDIGEIIEKASIRAGIHADFFKIRDESRINTALVHEARKEVSVINEPGPLMSDDEVEGFLRLARSSLDGASGLIVSGSAPRGFSERHLRQIVGWAEEAGIPVKADIAGIWLSSLTELPLDLLKLNHEEFLAAFGIQAGDLDSALEFKARHRIRELIITEGSKGSTAIDDGGACYKVELGNVRTEVAVGSGDSFFAGFLFAEARGQPFDECLHMASACGYANTLRYGAGVFSHEDVRSVWDNVRVQRIR
jgi:1-phosphofructokinase